MAQKTNLNGTPQIFNKVIFSVNGDTEVEINDYIKNIRYTTGKMSNYRNIGNRNLGFGNDGDDNLGNCNVGDKNTGVRNWGDGNFGKENYGDHNRGSRNWGFGNVGMSNIGNDNFGDQNFGDSNKGYGNSGVGNIGIYNKGNSLYGFFNTNTEDTTEFRFFNKPFPESLMGAAEFSEVNWSAIKYVLPNWLPMWLKCPLFTVHNKWIQTDEMTGEQKAEYPSHQVTGGILVSEQIDDYEETRKEAFRRAWNGTTQEDRMLTCRLPNFDADIFLEIFGFDVRAETAYY